MSDAGKREFHWELMKLLLQVVWADDAVATPERRVLLGLANRLSLDAEQIGAVERLLDGGEALPPPNLTLLRSRRDEVVEAAEQLVLADEEITDDENRLLAELNALLGLSEVPTPP